MPHLMNCAHSDTGWCLDCVKAMVEQLQRPTLADNPNAEPQTVNDYLHVLSCYISDAMPSESVPDGNTSLSS